jgi:rod shape determining protein RodA
LTGFFQAWRPLRRVSVGTTLVVLALLSIGVCFVFSSCYSSGHGLRALYRRQILWASVGLATYGIFAARDYRDLPRLAPWFYAVVLTLLALVLAIGTEIYGAKRWLMVFGFGLQPSEFAKLATILMLGAFMSRPGEDPSGPGTVAKLLALAAAPAVLTLKEPDLGTAAIFVPVSMAMMFVGGVPMRFLLSLAGCGLVAVALVLGALLLPEKLGLDEAEQARFWKWTGITEYQRTRVLIHFDPNRDPLGAGWNKRQSEIAIGSGGVWGKGFLNGTQNILGFLPRKVAYNDFIYSVIAEEKGFAGSATVLGLFLLLMGSGVRVAAMARDRFGRLLCVGVVAMMFSHVFINIAMTVGLLPITGLPLPLVSYGGSFMIVCMAELGIVQSVYIRSLPSENVRVHGGVGEARVLS